MRGCDRRAEHGSLTCPACAQQPWRVQRSARPARWARGSFEGAEAISRCPPPRRRCGGAANPSACLEFQPRAPGSHVPGHPGCTRSRRPPNAGRPQTRPAAPLASVKDPSTAPAHGIGGDGAAHSSEPDVTAPYAMEAVGCCARSAPATLLRWNGRTLSAPSMHVAALGGAGSGRACVRGRGSPRDVPPGAVRLRVHI